MDINVINLDDEDDDDLISICNTFDNHKTNDVSSTMPLSKSNSIVNYFDVYRKTEENSFKKIVPKSTNMPKDVIYLDDDVDDDLLEPVPFLNSNNKKKPSWPTQDNKKAKLTNQTKITSFYSNTNSNVLANSKHISDADAIAIANALDELDRQFENKTNPTLNNEIIDLEYILDVVELESYNENAAIIRSLSIVDPQLEQLDPNPDIHKLFSEFDQKFFDGFLGKQPLKLDWTNTAYSAAGLFYPMKNGVPTILLSSKLLILRPRRDLVETLLHEMIHAFIGLQGLRDNNDHGKLFQFHMKRINRETGTNITIYHSFHDEVAYWRKYIWRCNGKCRSIRPYCGFISLTTKRKPSRWDRAFRLHQQVGCSGTFVQVSDNFQK